MISDQIRKLENSRHIAGYLAELGELRQGTDKNGKGYINFEGVCQAGPEPTDNVHFRVYVSDKKVDGSDSANYFKVLEWYNDAIPMTKDKDNCTMMDMLGSIGVGDYVAKDGKLRKGFRNNMQFINNFNDFANELEIEGVLVTDVVEDVDKDENPTGRLKFRFMSLDFGRNVLDFNPVYVGEELANDIQSSGYDKDVTVKAIIEWRAVGNNKPQEKMAFGRSAKTTSGSVVSLPFLVGGSEPYEEDEMVINDAQIKLLKNERKNYISELEDAGYRGNDNKASKKGFSKPASTKPKSKMSSVEDDDDEDDELPF